MNLLECNSTARAEDPIEKQSKSFLRNFKKVLDKADRFGYNRKAAVDAAIQSNSESKKFFEKFQKTY